MSLGPEEIEGAEKLYNFGTSRFGGDEAPGVSVFYRDEQGNVFHTYSRGLDMLNGAYHYLDLVPKVATRTIFRTPWSGCDVATSTKEKSRSIAS